MNLHYVSAAEMGASWPPMARKRPPQHDKCARDDSYSSIAPKTLGPFESKARTLVEIHQFARWRVWAKRGERCKVFRLRWHLGMEDTWVWVWYRAVWVDVGLVESVGDSLVAWSQWGRSLALGLNSEIVI